MTARSALDHIMRRILATPDQIEGQFAEHITLVEAGPGDVPGEIIIRPYAPGLGEHEVCHHVHELLMGFSTANPVRLPQVYPSGSGIVVSAFDSDLDLTIDYLLKAIESSIWLQPGWSFPVFTLRANQRLVPVTYYYRKVDYSIHLELSSEVKFSPRGRSLFDYLAEALKRHSDVYKVVVSVHEDTGVRRVRIELHGPQFTPQPKTIRAIVIDALNGLTARSMGDTLYDEVVFRAIGTFRRDIPDADAAPVIV